MIASELIPGRIEYTDKYIIYFEGEIQKRRHLCIEFGCLWH
jgi:hypothetical protein